MPDQTQIFLDSRGTPDYHEFILKTPVSKFPRLNPQFCGTHRDLGVGAGDSRDFRRAWPVEPDIRTKRVFVQIVKVFETVSISNQGELPVLGDHGNEKIPPASMGAAPGLSDCTDRATLPRSRHRNLLHSEIPTGRVKMSPSLYVEILRTSTRITVLLTTEKATKNGVGVDEKNGSGS